MAPTSVISPALTVRRALGLLRVDVADLLLPEDQVLFAGGHALDLERAVQAGHGEEGMVEDHE